MKLSFFCMLAATLAACSPSQPADTATSEAAVATVRLQTARGEVEVAKNPQRLAVFDWAALDSLNSLGISVGATTAPVQVDYLQPLFAKAQTVGTLFEPDYEALHRYRPQLTVTSGPGAQAYPELAKQTPTIDMTIDNADIRTSGKARISAWGKLFGRETEAEQLNLRIDQAFNRARTAAKGKGHGLVISITGNKVSAFGTQSRLGSWIHQDLGVPASDSRLPSEGHGQPVSFEYIRAQNPNWLFVIDRTAALGQTGLSARAVLDNPLVAQTNAWRKGQVIYMPAANYIAAGGAHQLIQAASQLEAAFAAAQ